MDFTYDAEQVALRDAVRALVGKAYGDFENRRRVVAADPGFDAVLWHGLAEMGVLGLPFAEADGGSGAGPVEVAVVARELGRVLAPEPFLSSVVMAGGLVAAVGTDAQRAEVLGALSAGDRVLAFAHTEPGARWTAAAAAVSAIRRDDGWLVTGTKEPVGHGARADQLVVSAVLPDGGTGLFLVDGSATGLTRQGYPLVDGGRAALVTFEGTPAEPLGEPSDRSADIERVLAGARIIAANEALGAMEVALDTTVGYLGSRKQFGVTLSHFQALTFRAADMYVSLETTRSLVAWASMVLAEAPEQVIEAGSRVGLKVARAGRHIGLEAIQLHGGIGMTAEYSIGTYTAHLTALEQLYGNGHEHLGRLVATVGDHTEVDPLE
ncbi:MAG: acyl-CoA dehydrogenase family protein [Intrasporangium sp.]|uniref:acyl-CoA dehydrogenase family protein n=1 Tax=Intrasporangium sp. TaxID=1925024 RepID=UPI002649AFA1|nr:acyl-CoA dehydrogenase family protein [Intrasporangium sp.]MDN5796224.1 acyl-CoA dehydrogenase family protein [Intrasporangium sp.]